MLDCWYYILSYTNSPSTLRNTYLTCLDFADYYDYTAEGRVIKSTYISGILAFIKKFPGIPVNMSEISDNNSIPWSVIADNKQLNWKYWNLSRRQSIDWNYVRANIYKDWSWYSLSNHKDFPIDLIGEHNYKNINWIRIFREITSSDNHDELMELAIRAGTGRDSETLTYLTRNENPQMNLSWDLIIKYMDKNWDFISLSNKPNIPWHIVIGKPKLWSWYILSNRNDIDWDFWREHTNLPWDSTAILSNSSAPWDVIRFYAGKIKITDSIICKISSRPDLDWDFVLENLQLEWNWDELSQHPTFPSERIVSSAEVELRTIRSQIVPFDYLHRYLELNSINVEEVKNYWDWNIIFSRRF